MCLIDTIPTFRFPILSQGVNRAFEIGADSLLPVGTTVIGRLVELPARPAADALCVIVRAGGISLEPYEATAAADALEIWLVVARTLSGVFLQ